MANPVQNSASVMKSGSNVGDRSKNISKEKVEPSNANMEYKSAIEVKPGKSVGMAEPTEKPNQFLKKEMIQKEVQNKLEEAYNNKMLKIDAFNAQKNNNKIEEDKVVNKDKTVDPEKKSKLLNQKKIEELQKKLFDVQIRLKNTGRKVN